MQKCFRCGSTHQIKKCPSFIPVWGSKDLCRSCYAEIVSGHLKSTKRPMRKKVEPEKPKGDINFKYIAVAAIGIVIIFFIMFLF